MYQNKKAVLDEIKLIRNDLYDNLPVGSVDGFTLLRIIKEHINRLDELIKLMEQ